MPETELHRQLKVLSETVSQCTRCSLHSTRTQTVFQRGNPQAQVCIIGRDPGVEEDALGIAFVGRSGKLLDRTIQELGHDPATDIYICNVVKCHCPNNRPPTSQELQACWPHIENQLDLLPAKVILTLGSTATHTVVSQTKPISYLRGKVLTYKTKKCVPTFHPSFLIRSGNENSQHYPLFKADLALAFQLSKEN